MGASLGGLSESAALRGNPALTPLAWALSDTLLLLWLGLVATRLLALWRERSGAAVRRLDAVYMGLAAAGFVAMAGAVRLALGTAKSGLRTSPCICHGKGKPGRVQWSQDVHNETCGY